MAAAVLEKRANVLILWLCLQTVASAPMENSIENLLIVDEMAADRAIQPGRGPWFSCFVTAAAFQKNISVSLYFDYGFRRRVRPNGGFVKDV